MDDIDSLIAQHQFDAAYGKLAKRINRLKTVRNSQSDVELLTRENAATYQPVITASSNMTRPTAKKRAHTPRNIRDTSRNISSVRPIVMDGTYAFT